MSMFSPDDFFDSLSEYPQVNNIGDQARRLGTWS